MGVLDNVKVLDLSEKLSGSLATMYLKNLGARVTKIENPVAGDPIRQWQPMQNGHSLYFNYLNNGKESVAIDIRTEEGRELLMKMVPHYDVVCLDMEPRQREELNLTYEQLKEANNTLIYAGCSNFGDEGPMKYKAGSSLVVQAKGVAMDMTGVIDEYPIQAAPSITEHYAAGYLATGVLMALTAKIVSGEGQKVDISLQDSIFSSIEAAPAAYSTIGEIHTRKGNFDPSAAPYDTFKTIDGHVAIGCATQQQWERLCDEFQMDTLKNDPRFTDNEGRRGDYLFVLRPLLEVIFQEYTTGEIEKRCQKQKIPCSEVLTIAEITDKPHIRDNGFLRHVESEKAGAFIRPELAFLLHETPATIYADAPELGEHTTETLAEIGLKEAM